MTLPSKVGFFGLRREFNKAVSAILGLVTSFARLVMVVSELTTRLEALERRAEMQDLLDGVSARYDEIIIDSEAEVVEETDGDPEERTED